MIRFKQLDVWKEAKELALLTYRITELFPKSETFGLISQMQRAAVSVASNIVEGSGRQHKKEFVHFLYLSLGSLYELLTHAEIASEVGYVDHNDYSLL